MRAAISRIAAVAALSSIGACGAERPASRAPQSAAARLHRPHWIETIEVDVDAMVRCLEGRVSPSYVLYVYHDPSRLTAMTTLDAHGALEHCVVDGGTVLVREPSPERPEDHLGLPLFSLGAEPPVVPPLTRLEEVGVEGAILGWLHWPSQRPAPSRRARREASL